MKVIHVSGKRKRAVARATLREGSGRVTINKKDLSLVTPRISRLRIEEPLILAGDVVKKVDIEVNVFGGGVTGQADAVRVAISRALVAFEPKLKSLFLDYDRNLLVADVRRKEVRKPNTHGKARAKRQTSYR